MSAREAILQRLRNQQGPALPTAPERYAPQYGWSLEERIARFTAMMTAVRGEVIRCAETELLEQLRAVLLQQQIHKPFVSPKLGAVRDALCKDFACVALEGSVENWKTQVFDDIDASVTSARGGIAETGSLILWPDAEEPRLLSLVPPVHIAVLRTADIDETFAASMDKDHWATQMPTNALLISGPSKTADIEQTLAYGIHGPKQLIVLLLD